MQVSATQTNGANAVIAASFDKAALIKAEESVAAKIAKEANFHGFRKGKVPASVVKSRYKEQLERETKSKLASDAFEEGLKSLNKPDLIGMPVVTKAEEKDGGLNLELKLSIRPAIELGDYLALTPAHSAIEASEKELAETLQKAADSTAVATAIEEDRALKEGDIAQFDFKGFIGGEPMQNGAAENYELKIGSKSFIPGFEDQMIGLKKGETKRFSVKFPDDYHAKEIAGKEAEFEVKLSAIKVKNPVAIDDEVAKKLLPNMKDASLEKLREAAEKSLIEDKKQKLYNEELRPQLLDALVKNYKFDLPEVILDQEIDHLATQKARTMKEEDLRALQGDEAKLKALREEFREEATERVKTTLLIDAIAKAEKIAVSDQEVAQAIYYQALQTGQDPKATLDYYRKNNLLAVVRMSLTEDRVLTTLLDKKAAEAPAETKAKEGGAEKKPAKKAAKKKDAE